MTPQTFIQKWGPGGPAFYLNEEQGAQSHFLDLCELLGVPKPGSEDGYLFEEKNAVIGGRTGYADVFRRGAFAWENKAPGKNLDAALKQLLTYSLALSNPPILVVCDRLTLRIHTQFTGHPTETHTVILAEFDQPDKLALLRRIWTAPESFRPKKTSRDITEAAAKSFATLADSLRKRGASKDHDATAFQAHADEVAHFLTQCLFCFFAEDVGLLPGRMFEGLVNNRKLTSDKLTGGLRNLFTVMRNGGLYGNDDIPWFNGGLFKKIAVPELSVLEVTELRNAAALNWSAIDVSIFGTLFERGLDPSKRSQLGAHYTDPATIMRIVEPVLQRPLLQIWDQTALVIKALLAKSKKKNDASYKAARVKFIEWLDQLENYRVLDPACGSGNFLFLGLKTLKDIEHKSHIDAAAMGLDREADLVTGPHNMLGIELNEYAAELARVTVWIGELQWRLMHGYEFKTNPVLEPLDHIECRDALINQDGSEATWPKADVVVANPPFVGDKKMRRELGDEYTETIRQTYRKRVAGGADFVCYWFERARAQMEGGLLTTAGLVSTNMLPVGTKNKLVLNRVLRNATIFEAWRDLPWVNEGAAVRVALTAFGKIFEPTSRLNGEVVMSIGSDLEARDETLAVSDASPARLSENKSAALQGITKGGKFELSGKVARVWLTKPNPNGRSSSDVILPWWNGEAVTQRNPDMWIVDFFGMDETHASMYEEPFAHVLKKVKPERDTNNEPNTRKNYWLFKRSGADMRGQISRISRAIVSPETPTHTVFAWLPKGVIADKNLVVIARSDDVTFGVLSSKMHFLWTQRFGAPYGNHPTARRYTNSRTFDPYPFPFGLTPAQTAHKQTELLPSGEVIPAKLAGALQNTENPSTGSGRTEGDVRGVAVNIARAAKCLNDLREAWLNPPEWVDRVPEVIPLGMTTSPYPDRILPKAGYEKDLAERTLTKLYNQRPAWLDAVHKELDAAVAAAYGWADYTADMPDEEILKRLLALNLERAKAERAKT